MIRFKNSDLQFTRGQARSVIGLTNRNTVLISVARQLHRLHWFDSKKSWKLQGSERLASKVKEGEESPHPGSQHITVLFPSIFPIVTDCLLGDGTGHPLSRWISCDVDQSYLSSREVICH